MGKAGVPALLDTLGTEIDILGVGLAIELRREQPHHMHRGLAAIARQFTHRRAVALGLRDTRGELVDDVPQPVKLLLAVIWLAIRLEYCTSFWRLNTSAIVFGSAPCVFQR